MFLADRMLVKKPTSIFGETALDCKKDSKNGATRKTERIVNQAEKNNDSKKEKECNSKKIVLLHLDDSWYYTTVTNVGLPAMLQADIAKRI